MKWDSHKGAIHTVTVDDATYKVLRDKDNMKIMKETLGEGGRKWEMFPEASGSFSKLLEASESFWKLLELGSF